MDACDKNQLKQKLQDFFTDALVTIVGKGLSIAEGVPGMGNLKDHLIQNIQVKETPLEAQWQPILQLLKSGIDLESALNQNPPSNELEALIVQLTAKYIASIELDVIEKVIEGKKELRLTRLFKHMLKPKTGIPVITTNYDRLIEVAAECCGLGVDVMFCGNYISFFNPKESKLSLCRDVDTARGMKSVYLKYREYVKVFKPHGSLDWYLKKNEPIRCSYDMDLPKLIITPGFNKYINGYDRPFDVHRDKANQEIDKASRYLIIGYGFNDSHLETHLTSQLKAGKQALIITHALMPKAQELVRSLGNITAIFADPVKSGSWIETNNKRMFLEGPNIWDIGIFIDEVLEP